LKNKKIKGSLSITVLSLEKIEKRIPSKKINFKDIAKFPKSQFDCTVAVVRETSVRSILVAAKKLKAPEFESVRIVGTYNIGEGEKTVTLRFSFHSAEKTIDTKRLKELENLSVSILEKNNFFLKK